MKYRKKPVVIEAVQWTGYFPAITDFCSKAFLSITDMQYLMIPTLEGVMMANIGDYIIKGVEGEFYPCKERIFISTYEALP